jgi:hypothetical protein
MNNSYYEFIELILIEMLIHHLSKTSEENDMILCDITKMEKLFEKVKPVFKYYRNLQEKNQITIKENETEITLLYFPSSFQDFVDKTFNVKKQSGFEYKRLIDSMKKEEFRKRVENVWHKEQEDKRCKNNLIHKIKEILYHKKDNVYIDIRSYLEYLSIRKSINLEIDEIEEKAIYEISEFLCIYTNKDLNQHSEEKI